ncbi:MAG: type II toxin-antitoxin system mRNA interferase toxin, RelE/StbE family [Candidatus Zambryskibacteria bacterium]|nr:type II toxin-antitoxin system mRNA interferase toxin, RelE/StbE family [Candidatus Zambryskibacteria bacterium]
MFFIKKSFKKNFKKLPQSVKESFQKRMMIFLRDEYDPLLRTHKLNPPWVGYKSIDITGDVRLIYKIEGGVCKLYRIGTHAELYE